ncbi:MULTISPECIES: SRPBCC family protein [Phyllobacterium]|uniref:SRPBCC family protein n=1 Tax=Phyllobacterium TaxID=28100 RepID=UPI001CBF20AA|nr:SRPBCC family protein [Phyllobacterium calauticae]MBZ3691583.1 SRPBCC family protein [Phyllobacterium calauticae]
MVTRDSRTLQVSIERDWHAVYDFASNPENVPKWASGLASGLQKLGDEWLADGPVGKLRIRFAPLNAYGVLDHWVMTETGEEVYVPLRVIPNNDGCEVSFTLFRMPDMSEGKFAEDAAWVLRDLTALKAVLETQQI